MCLYIAITVLQSVRPELADKDEYEDQTGLETLMEGDQKHHTQLPGTTTADSKKGVENGCGQ